MAKRFTDSRKWRNEWFRKLPDRAKLAWTYLCDECDGSGVWKADYGLASFQLSFKITPEILEHWFSSKLYFFDTDKILIVQFFEFQYGESKENWSAKIAAKNKLEALGFVIEKNKVSFENIHAHPTVGAESETLLIRVKGNYLKDKDKISENEFQEIYKSYPRKKGKEKGLDKARTQIKTREDLELLKIAISNYRADLSRNETPAKYIKHFDSFMSSWRDCLDQDYGASEKFQKKQRAEVFIP